MSQIANPLLSVCYILGQVSSKIQQNLLCGSILDASGFHYVHKVCFCVNALCIMHSKTKWMYISAQHHSVPRHPFRVDCFGCLPVLYKVNNQQGHTSSQQCTNPLLIISRILHNKDTVTTTALKWKCSGSPLSAEIVGYRILDDVTS